MKSRWVVGFHAVREALLARPQWVKSLYVLDGKNLDSDFARCVESSGVSPRPRGPKFFADLSSVHQGVAAEMKERPRFRWDLMSEEGSPSVLLGFLDGLKDPHNLGAILRSSWLLGVAGLFVPKDHSVGLTPTAAKVACGAVEHVPVESCHFGQTLKSLKEQGFWVYGASANGSKSIGEVQMSPRSIMVLGSEGRGLRKSTEKLCDELVALPQAVSQHSFNVSVAFSLITYEYTRQHGTLGKH